MNSINQTFTKTSTRQWFDRGGRKPVIIETAENLLQLIYGRRSKMLQVSRKMIQIKAKAIDEKINDPAVKKTFIASSDWIQNFMGRHHLS